jgi:hypothetical protein
VPPQPPPESQAGRAGAQLVFLQEDRPAMMEPQVTGAAAEDSPAINDGRFNDQADARRLVHARALSEMAWCGQGKTRLKDLKRFI